MLHLITLTSSTLLPTPIVEKTSDRQHPDAHIHGFTLRALYVHAPSQTIERHALRFDDHPHLIDPNSAHSRRLQTDIPAFSATTNSKERVIALLGLNVAAYPGYHDAVVSSAVGTRTEMPLGADSKCCGKPTFDFGWGQVTMDGIDVEDRLWDPTNSSKFADDAAHHAISEAYMAVFADSAAAEGTTLDELYWPYTAKYDIGVAALEWQRGDIKVLCFRGSYSGGDMSNIPNWFIDFVLEKSTAKLKKAWTEDAGLEWGADQQERESQSTSDLAARTAIRGMSSDPRGNYATAGYVEGFDADLVTAVGDDPEMVGHVDGLTEEEAFARGYWTITKALVDHVYGDTASSESLLLTGHSQGATRAQFASMYLREKEGVAIPTLSFAATGAACSARMFYHSVEKANALSARANILDDVGEQPYVAQARHSPLTTHRSPLTTHHPSRDVRGAGPDHRVRPPARPVGADARRGRRRHDVLLRQVEADEHELGRAQVLRTCLRLLGAGADRRQRQHLHAVGVEHRVRSRLQAVPLLYARRDGDGAGD